MHNTFLVIITPQIYAFNKKDAFWGVFTVDFM